MQPSDAHSGPDGHFHVDVCSGPSRPPPPRVPGTSFSLAITAAAATAAAAADTAATLAARGPAVAGEAAGDEGGLLAPDPALRLDEGDDLRLALASGLDAVLPRRGVDVPPVRVLRLRRTATVQVYVRLHIMLFFQM